MIPINGCTRMTVCLWHGYSKALNMFFAPGFGCGNGSGGEDEYT